MDFEDILFFLGMIIGIAICSVISYYGIVPNWWIAIPVGVLMFFCVIVIGLDVLHMIRGK